MPTTLANTTQVGEDKVKMRWKEPYVTEGLNKKMHGAIPRGIIRGGLLVTNANGLEVKILADPISGDVIASYVDDDGEQTTVDFGSGNVVVDMSAAAGSTVYLCLYVGYEPGSDTIVEWRAYTEAELFGVSPVAEADNVVIFGKVVVPGTGPISAGSVTHEHRRDAWTDQSTGLISWNPVVCNGDFEQKWTWWSVFGGTHCPPSLSTSPYEGNYCLQVQGDGAGAGSVYLAQNCGMPVVPGELLKVRAMVYDTGWDGSGGFTGFNIWYADKDGLAIGVGDDVVSIVTGDASWNLVEKIVEVPADAAYILYVRIMFDQTATNSNTLRIDNFQVFRQQIGPHKALVDRDKFYSYHWTNGIVISRLPTNDYTNRDNFQIAPSFADDKLILTYSGSTVKPIEVADETYLRVKHDLAADDTPDAGFLGLTNLCQAWVKFDLEGTSTPTVRDAFNISTASGVGVTRVSNGVYRVNLLDPFPNTDYVVNVTLYWGVSPKPVSYVVNNKAYNRFDLYIWEWNAGTQDFDLTDNSYISVMISVYGRRT